jgi:DNA repair photolyase
MNWEKVSLKISSGEIVSAQAPLIISASRATDIPAFYTSWLLQRLKEGHVRWKNRYNGTFLYVSFSKARVIVLWSKNPEPIIKHLDEIREIIPNFYFQYTLNDYDSEKIEPRVPSVNQRIDTFIRLSEEIGKEKVIWRFDPLILTKTLDVDELLKRVEIIGNQLKNYTKKMVFSFADIGIYQKVQQNLNKSVHQYREFDENSMHLFAKELSRLNEQWQFEIGTCAEKIPLETYGIKHNKCIDDEWMIKLFSHDRVLMDFLGANINEPSFFPAIPRNTARLKDNGQRPLCGCIASKDIGAYNTCPHLCEYCYANFSPESVLRNREKYKENPNNDIII